MLFNKNNSFNENDDLTNEDSALIMESVLLEGLTSEELDDFLSSAEEVKESLNCEVLQEKSIVRLDKMAKLSKAKQTAVYTVARERKDPLFKKLLTVWRLERFIQAKLNKKYGNEANRRAKKSMQKSSSAKGKTVKKAVDRQAMRVKRNLKGLKDTGAKNLLGRIN